MPCLWTTINGEQFYKYLNLINLEILTDTPSSVTSSIEIYDVL